MLEKKELSDRSKPGDKCYMSDMFPDSAKDMINSAIEAGYRKGIEKFGKEMIKLGCEVRSWEKLYAKLFRTHQLASLGVMASGLAHEINQPLQMILATAQNCKKDIECNAIDTRGIKADLEDIADTVRKIDRIVNHLQVLSRDRRPEAKPLDINRVIENSLIMFSQQLKSRGIRIEKNLADNLPRVSADMIQLEQVFINLISNARDILEENGENKRIVISTCEQNTHILVRFEDNGKGISSENPGKIFTPFFTTKENGTGLGLYIVRDIIGNYDGTITVESKINEGTTFIIRLPAEGKEREI